MKSSDILKQAIVNKDWQTLDKFIDETPDFKEKILAGFSLSIVSAGLMYGDDEVMRHILQKPPFTNLICINNFFNNLMNNRDAKKRESLLIYFAKEKLSLITVKHKQLYLMNCLGYPAFLDKITIQDEYVVADYGFTPLHYALLSGYEISKNLKILDSVVQYEKYLVKLGHNRGASFLLLLAVPNATKTIDTLLNYYPNHVFDITATFENKDHLLHGITVIWYLAYNSSWSTLKRLLANNKKDIINLKMCPTSHSDELVNKMHLHKLLLLDQQWAIFEDCLLRDDEQYIPLATMYGNEKLSDYLKRHQQTRLLKILEEREAKDTQKKQLQLAYSKKLQTLVSNNQITVANLQKLIKLGADPDIEYPSILKAAFFHDRYDIISELLKNYGVKLSNHRLKALEDFLWLILQTTKQQLFCKWLLEDNNFEKMTEGLSHEHIKVMAGIFELKLEDRASWPFDKLGLTPFHYAWLGGITFENEEQLQYFKQFPLDCHEITAGIYKGSDLSLVLCEFQAFGLMRTLLQFNPGYKFNLAAKSISGVTALYCLAVHEKWELLLDLWRTNPESALLEVTPNEDYFGGDGVPFTLLLAEKNIKILLAIYQSNPKQKINVEATFPSDHSNAGITLAWLLAYKQEWQLLQQLCEQHMPSFINLEAKPLHRDGSYGNPTLRQLLKIHHQDELLARLQKNTKSSKKDKKVTNNKKPSINTAPQTVDVADKTPSRQQTIEERLTTLLAGTLVQSAYQQDGKKVFITFHARQEPLNTEQAASYQADQKKIMAKLLMAKNLKGNEGITVDGERGILRANSEGSMYSFFNNAKVLEILKNDQKQTPVSIAEGFNDTSNLVPLALSEAQQEQWRKALLPGFCDALQSADIIWDATKNCFKIRLTPGEWRVRDYKSAHHIYECYEITDAFLKEMVAKIEIFLSGSKGRPLFAKTSFEDNCLIIVPYVEEIPLLSEVQTSLYKKISKKCQKLTSQSITVTQKSDDKKNKTETTQINTTQDSNKDNETESTDYIITADNLKELLQKIAVDFEFKFLYEKDRLSKDGQCHKVIFCYHCQGAFFVNGQISIHLILALRGALEEYLPGFMHVYRHDQLVIVSFNLNKAIPLSAKQVASLQAGFSEQMASFLQNPLKLELPSQEKNKHLIKLALHTLPKQSKKSSKAKQAETEAEIFTTLKSAIQKLCPKTQNNVMHHLNQTKKLTRPLPNPAMEYAYLLHVMQIYGALESRHIENGLLYKFRNLTRHVVDENNPVTACASLCDKAEPLLILLRSYFIPASITHVNVSLFAPQKSDALAVIRAAVTQFLEALQNKTLSQMKDHTACLNHYLNELANIHDHGIPTKEDPDYIWKRDATLMLCGLIEEIRRDGTYADIYRLIGHEYKQPYESLADDLYAAFIAQLNVRRVYASR